MPFSPARAMWARVNYIRLAFSRVWAAMLVAWGALGAADFLLARFLPESIDSATPRFSDVTGDADWTLWLVGILLIFVVALVEGGHRHHRALQDRLDGPLSEQPLSEEGRIAEELRVTECGYADGKQTGDWMYTRLADLFRDGVTFWELRSNILQQFADGHDPETASNLADAQANSIIDDWYSMGLLKTEQRETETWSDYPASKYQAYLHSDLGLRVLRALRS